MKKNNLMLIPGLNNTNKIWKYTLPLLEDEYHVLTPKLPKYNSVVDIADSLVKDIKEPFVVCGYSFGGYIALAMLERYPDLIEKVVLIASHTFADSPNGAHNRKKLIERAKNGEYIEMMEASKPNTFHSNHIDEEIMLTRDEMVKEYGAESFIKHATAAIHRNDFTKLFQQAPIPKLIIASKEDKVMPFDKLSELASSSDNTAFKVVEKSGHAIPFEQPTQLVETLKEWLDAID